MENNQDANEFLKESLETIFKFFKVKLVTMDAVVETMLYNLDKTEFLNEVLPLSDPAILLPRSRIHIIATAEHEGNNIKFFGLYFMTRGSVEEEAMEAYEATSLENIEKSEEILRKALKLCMDLFRHYVVDYTEST
jgi:hypothetical protein